MANPSSAARKKLEYDVTAIPVTPRKWEFAAFGEHSSFVPPFRGTHGKFGTEDEMFAKLSGDGWELVTVTLDGASNRRYYFKRPL